MYGLCIHVLQSLSAALSAKDGGADSGVGSDHDGMNEAAIELQRKKWKKQRDDLTNNETGLERLKRKAGEMKGDLAKSR